MSTSAAICDNIRFPAGFARLENYDDLYDVIYVFSHDFISFDMEILRERMI